MPKEKGWKYEVKPKCLGCGCGAADSAAAAAAADDDDDDSMNMSLIMRMTMNNRRIINNMNVTSYHNSEDNIDDEHEVP